MKKALTILVASIACTLCMISCKSNSDAFSRESFVGPIINLQATEDISSLSPETKYELWAYKIKDILNSYSISAEEKEALNKILALTSPEAMVCESNEWTKLKQSIAEATTALGWDEDKAFAYLGTILTIDEFKELVANKAAKGMSTDLDLSQF